jgi:hypothetical protein
MDELQRNKDELKESQDDVLKLGNSLYSKESTIKDLHASRKFLSEELDVAKDNIGVLESVRVVLQAAYDKVMGKAICACHLLMKRPDIVVPKDILVDVLLALGTVAKIHVHVSLRLTLLRRMTMFDHVMHHELEKV